MALSYRERASDRPTSVSFTSMTLFTMNHAYSQRNNSQSSVDEGSGSCVSSTSVKVAVVYSSTPYDHAPIHA